MIGGLIGWKIDWKWIDRLKVTSARDVETSVDSNQPFQSATKPYDEISESLILSQKSAKVPITRTL